MPRCVVTGGAGFIGSHLVDALVARGHSVRVFDNLSSGREANLVGVAGRIEFIHGDIRDADAVRAAMADVEFVFHEAAVPSVAWSLASPLESHAINETGTLNVLAAARQAGVRRVIYASSCAVYGSSNQIPLSEAQTPCPQSPYATAKLMGEYYSRVFAKAYGLETIVLRYFNVFGPRQREASDYGAVIPNFIACLEGGRNPVIFGDGAQSRDFVEVGNVVRANIQAMTTAWAAGEVFNVASGERCSVLDLLGILNRTGRYGIPPRFAEPRPGEVRDSVAQLDKAREHLGYTVAISLEEGLKRSIAWFRDQQRDDTIRNDRLELRDA